MRIGILRHQIQFMRNMNVKNDYGEQLDVWENVRTVFAAKEPILGKEYFSAETIQSNVAVKFRCRWFAGVTNDMQIWHGSERYHIESAVNVKELDREFLIYCSKVVDTA